MLNVLFLCAISDFRSLLSVVVYRLLIYPSLFRTSSLLIKLLGLLSKIPRLVKSQRTAVEFLRVSCSRRHPPQPRHPPVIRALTPPSAATPAPTGTDCSLPFATESRSCRGRSLCLPLSLLSRSLSWDYLRYYYCCFFLLILYVL